MQNGDSKNWLVYIIRASDDSFYTGVTTDVERRFAEHAGGKRGARFFNGRQPLEVIYTETGHSRSSACQREAVIKRMSRAQKNRLVEN